ncbi:MAG: hypothetical protein IAA97_02760 [Spirochaetes bacterium]|uniref:Uncharacterized protein n=1 Tax=Candidatus Ornithospirochaeta stercoripullorum TaxID=2840899 RepID=A0A9D9E0E7_9SPIO|nr:hypothetical protein [Candidatus Ornithospirochaeta stercoripullorum]
MRIVIERALPIEGKLPKKFLRAKTAQLLRKAIRAVYLTTAIRRPMTVSTIIMIS